MRTRERPYEWGAFLSLVLLAGCAASPNTDLRAEHLYACEAYTTALEDLQVWRNVGKLDDEQWAVVQTIEANTSPLCLGELTVDGADLVMQSSARLEALLIAVISQERNS